MKKLILYIFLFFSMASIQGQDHPFIDLVMHESSTKSTTLRESLDDDYNYLVMFSTRGCGWCKRALKAWQTHLNDWREKYNLKIVVVIRGSQATYNSTVSGYTSLPYKLYVYNGSYGDLGITGVPHSFIMDRSHRILKDVRGYRSAAALESILDTLQFDTYSYLDDYTYTVTLRKGCEDEESIQYTSRSLGGSRYWIDGDHEIDLNIEVSSNPIDEDSQQSLFPKASILCQDITVFDPIHNLSISGKLIDSYLYEGDRYLVTDIPMDNCEEEASYFTIIENTTTNAGLLPLLGENGVISSLECVHKDEEYIIYGDADACKPSKVEENHQDDLFVYPNPSSKYLLLGGIQDTNIEIMDITNTLGQKYDVTYTSGTKTISIEYLPVGLYHLRLRQNDRYVNIPFVKM